MSAIGRDHIVRPGRKSDVRRVAQALQKAVEPTEKGQIELIDAYEVRSEKLSLDYGVVSYNEVVRSGRSVSHSVGVGHLIVLALPCDLGRIWIRPEGLLDKLSEFVVSGDIDFAEHPRFSSRYLLHADDPELLNRRVSAAFWQAFGEQRRLVAVGRGATLVIGKDGGLHSDDAADLVALGFRLLRAFGSPVS
ncbi:MAG TPA: hypothetical protein VFV87_11210 [Pirellulaceae bacterium]|nr:hypothetical protein [Pirellulaceae bacterium]